MVSCNVVHTYHGGRSQTVLGRTMLLPHPADDSRLLVVAGDEPSQSVSNRVFFCCCCCCFLWRMGEVMHRLKKQLCSHRCEFVACACRFSL